MANVSISISRDSGIVLNASCEVADEQILEMCSLIGAMIFDASIGMPEGLSNPE